MGGSPFYRAHQHLPDKSGGHDKTVPTPRRFGARYAITDWTRMIRKLIFSLVTLAFLSVAALVLGETALRLYQFSRYGSGALGSEHGLYVRDPALGWKMRENMSFDTTETDASGRKHPVHFQTFTGGFRAFGDPRSPRKKLFFIGDSYTAATGVSNDLTYFGRIGALKEAEIFAYGGPGYGSLQEFMVLDKYLDAIGPDAVIIQFCWNDFLDNNYNLDPLRSLYNGDFKRPHLDPDHGGIVNSYATYGRFFITLPDFIAENLRILKYINQKVGQLYSRYAMADLDDIEARGTGNTEFRKSVEITRSILLEIKARAGSRPVFLFCIPYRQPYYDQIRELCRTTGIEFIPGIGEKLVEREKETPLVTKLADLQHLNEEGNRVVFEGINRFLIERGILRKAR